MDTVEGPRAPVIKLTAREDLKGKDFPVLIAPMIAATVCRPKLLPGRSVAAAETAGRWRDIEEILYVCIVGRR